MQQDSAFSSDVGIVDLRLVIQQLWKFSWLIVLMGLGFALLAAAFAVRPAPYEVHATLSIEPSGLNEAMVSLNDIDIEMGRIRSWTPVERVISQMPFYGIVKLHDPQSPLQRAKSVQKFLKTGKKHEELDAMPIKVEQLRFPAAYHGKTLTLTVGEANDFTIVDDQNIPLFDGVVGGPPPRNLNIDFYVSEINVPAGTQFHITPLSENAMIERTLTQFKIKKRSTSTKASLIDLHFFSPDPSFALDFTASIMQDYIQNTMERIRQSKQQSLISMENELDSLNQQLMDAEAELTNYMQQLDVADVDNEMRDRLQLRLSLEQDLRKIQLEKAKLKQIYTAQHPAMLALEEKELRLEYELAQAQESLEALPKVKGELYRLTRLVEKLQQEYALLLEQTTALKLESSALTNPASVVNTPRIVLRNLRNKALQIIILGGMMGGIIAFSFIALRANFMASQLNKASQLGRFPHLSMRDVEQGERNAVVEEVASQLIYLSRRRRSQIAMMTSLHQSHGGHKIILDICRHFAAEEGKILLIDANIKSAFSEITQEEGKRGFSNLMTGDGFLEEMVTRLDHPNLFYMPPGNPPASLTVLRDFERLEFILEKLSQLFSCIVIDLPGNQELPFWETLLNEAGLVVHLVRKKSELASAKQYLYLANQLAEKTDKAIHEVVLYPPKLK